MTKQAWRAMVRQTTFERMVRDNPPPHLDDFVPYDEPVEWPLTVAGANRMWRDFNEKMECYDAFTRRRYY